jgi:hypothetical protein
MFGLLSIWPVAAAGCRRFRIRRAESRIRRSKLVSRRPQVDAQGSKLTAVKPTLTKDGLGSDKRYSPLSQLQAVTWKFEAL